MPRLCSAHIQSIRLAVEVDFERNARLHRREIEHLCNIKIFFLRIPSCGPQCPAEHIGDVGDRRISTWNEKDFNRCITGWRWLVRYLMRCKHLAGAGLDHRERLASVL